MVRNNLFISGMEDDKRLDLQDKLIDVIMRVLVLRPELYYYQVPYEYQANPWKMLVYKDIGKIENFFLVTGISI